MNTLKKWLSTISYKLKLIKCIIFDEPISVKKRDASIDEIVSRNDKMRALENKKLEEAQAAEKTILVKCPVCNSTVDILYICKGCGKVICENCGTFCPEDINASGKTEPAWYCEQCW